MGKLHGGMFHDTDREDVGLLTLYYKDNKFYLLSNLNYPPNKRSHAKIEISGNDIL